MDPQILNCVFWEPHKVPTVLGNPHLGFQVGWRVDGLRKSGLVFD